ncbi:hypothetical protein ABL78_2908 [Leptomonas seymouri]|uniref:Leucine-rich repeat protein n=1 Tax=Leptomonas seymouri TaxID=5684 RepID=A0A0N1I0A7_LEPSE|nr:hypothetical protein ABL78_2908 [Leptomonas seymouri]|eukprot:KPI88032.1 hypothetical protein ABL78_2908 [Leptomonas seymouri]
MQARVTSLLNASINQQQHNYQAQVERQSRPSRGFLLKVNGTQLRSAVVKQRKRPRGTGGTAAEVYGEAQHDVDDEDDLDWPSVVIAALEDTFNAFESRLDSLSSATSGAGEATSSVSSLKSLCGVEIRHCRLQATHIYPGAEASTSLSQLLLSPGRLWNHHATSASHTVLCSSITTLDLECNLLGDDGVERLCSHLLPCLPHLQRLLLASNRITAVGFVNLLRTLSSSKSTHPGLALEALGLTNNAVGCFYGGCSVEEGCEKLREAWLEVVQAFVRCVASTLRRVHLNHAALSTREVVVLIDALFQHSFSGRDPCVFDLLYLRENKQVSKDEVVQQLHIAAADRSELDEFVKTHLSW